MNYYAHSLKDQPVENWETMQQHEDLVAKYCHGFLEGIDPSLGAWGDLLGKWHDLGKYSNAFQNYIKAANAIGDDSHRSEVKGKVDHSTAAAQFAIERFELRGRLLSYCFAGHHAGLPDWDDGQSQSGLKQRLKKQIPDWSTGAPIKLTEQSFPGMPSIGEPKPDNADHAAFRVSFWLRMIFSTLVDADFLATEAFMSPDRKASRPENEVTLADLRNVVEAKLNDLESNATDTNVNRIRKQVSADCLTKADLPPGFFSMEVPTGGGKTLASLRFALNHAMQHDLRRVIFAVPFTSIIEQNAKVYRDLFAELGDNTVLEHHSNLDPENETTTNRLQAENWDAPLVVTTNVQFFESLFASRTSRCRKLHRIANSVIVLDEAQTLPIELLQPTLLALRELVDTFGCSVVLCSATQPALSWRDNFPIGIKNVRPIIEDSAKLHQSLKRTKVRVAGKIEDEELASQLADCSQVLCIVNTRNHAAETFERLTENDSSGCFHLSTRMCAAHRMEKLDEIRRRLKAGEPCRVVSTQLIEAGVDVDFPVVYRVSCGLDSLAQAAGRCNREGLLESGEVIFFEAEKLPPVGFLRQSADSGSELIEDFRDDLLSPSAIETYFELHYWKKSDSWDKHEVLQAIGNQPSKLQFNFRQVASRYRFIRDETQAVIIGYGEEGQQLLKKLNQPIEYIHRNTWRRLQRYTVQLRQHELSILKTAGALETVHERPVLTQEHLYDDSLGLKLSLADGLLPIDDCIF
jgi:CRISPR-associated endonuclease/helicase Cas3